MEWQVKQLKSFRWLKWVCTYLFEQTEYVLETNELSFEFWQSNFLIFVYNSQNRSMQKLRSSIFHIIFFNFIFISYFFADLRKG